LPAGIDCAAVIVVLAMCAFIKLSHVAATDAVGANATDDIMAAASMESRR
jgi:hypothetical protein